MLNKDDVKQKLRNDCGCLIEETDIEEWILDYNEAGWMISRNASAFYDLLPGAIRQLDIEMKELIEVQATRITMLETAIVKEPM